MNFQPPDPPEEMDAGDFINWQGGVIEQQAAEIARLKALKCSEWNIHEHNVLRAKNAELEDQLLKANAYIKSLEVESVPPEPDLIAPMYKDESEAQDNLRKHIESVRATPQAGFSSPGNRGNAP